MPTATGSYTQSFDTLPTTGATNTWGDDSTIPSWYAAKTVTATPLSTISASDGSSSSGALYSFGTGTTTERALGTVGSGTPGGFAYGVLFQNTSGGTLVINSIAYRGEQWRTANSSAQTVDFSYQIAAIPISSLDPGIATSSAWLALTTANFTSPVTIATTAALDGNAAGNFVNVSVSSAISIPAGKYIMLRWRDIDHTGNDHGLAIDGVNIGWGAVAPPTLSLVIASPSIVEGGVSTATITRTGDLTAALTVDVISSDTTAATTPSTATFAANSATATFNITGFNDTIQDGAQSANITVSFTGYTPDSKSITVNDDTVDVSLLTINEVCGEATADNNGDGIISNSNDEFIELVNTSGASLDISGWTISDNGGVTFTFPLNTTVLNQQAVLIFGGGTVPPSIGSAIAFKSTSGTNLNNTGGDLVAVKNGTTLIARMTYSGTITGQVPSFNLNGDLIPGPFVLHNAITGAVGNFSPGKKVNGTEFITLNPLSLTLNPTSILETAQTSTGTVMLPGGAVGPATVYLYSSNTLKATLPTSVNIVSGLSSANFAITSVDNIEPDGTVNVTITASTFGYNSAQATLAVVSDADPVPAATLAPGSIAFTVFNADGGDDFGFVALTPIAEGTVIRFTDNEWNGQPFATTGVFNTGEGFLSWTAPTGGVPVGTVVTINNAAGATPTASNVFDIFGSTPYGTVSGSVNLNITLESLYAYQGTQLHASGFLSVIANHTGDSVVGTGLSASQTIYLTTGTRIGAYKSARTTQTSFANYLPLIADVTNNWDKQTALVSPSTDTSTDGVTPDVPFDYTVFSLAAPTGTLYSSWASTNTGSASSPVTGDHDNDGVSNGLEYFMGATSSTFTANPGIVGGKITWPKDPAFLGTYTVQISPNLTSWASVASTVVGNTVEYTPTGSAPLFIRMSVTPTLNP